MRYRFGPLHIDTQERVLRNARNDLPLPRKAVATLLVLLAAAPRVVRHDDLCTAVWPDGIASDANLAQQIYLLRRVLSQAGLRGAITTIPRVGYRFDGPCTRTVKAAPARAVPSEKTHSLQHAIRLLERRDASSLWQARRILSSHVVREPRNATAIAFLAYCDVLRVEYRHASPALLQPAERAAYAALAIDDDAVPAHIVLGEIASFKRANWDEADRWYRLGSRTSRTGRSEHAHAWSLMLRADWNGARSALLQAARRTPNHRLYAASTGALALFSGDPQLALTILEPLLSGAPCDAAIARYYYAKGLVALDRPHAAIDILERSLDGELPIQMTIVLAHALVRAGRVDDARARTSGPLFARRGDRALAAVAIASACRDRGERTAALDALQACGDPWARFVAIDPMFSIAPIAPPVFL